MKLFRFELLEQPGTARSGMVHNGRIYELEGGNAVAAYEPEQVRPLPPLNHAGSLRIFRRDLQPDVISLTDEPRYFYGNTNTLVGASTLIGLPDVTSHWEAEAYVAAVIGGDSLDPVDVEEADSFILGLTLLILIVARDVEREEKRLGVGFGRSYDLAGTIGPVITTPDELDEQVDSFENGRHYSLEARLKVNQVEVASGNLEDLPLTFSQAIAAASRTGGIRVGDVFALGPILPPTSLVDPGDDVIVSVDHMGALSAKLVDRN